ncbi:MAG: P-loop NTPase, partial [Bacteroidaceae bacterium]|nr:P-loop NTPase [Bacteroidaceae bacterium]
AELPENKYYLFGREGVKTLAEEMNVPLLAQIPLVQSICESGDQGEPAALETESITGKAFAQLAEAVVRETKRRNQQLPPTEVVAMKK